MPAPMLRNFYYCEDCGVSWVDDWCCACDDECPSCGKDFTPYTSEPTGEMCEHDDCGEDDEEAA